MTGSHPSPPAISPFDAGIRLVLGGLSFLLPAVFHPSLADPFHLPKEVLFRCGVLLILGLWLGGVLFSGRISLRRTAVAPPLLLFLFIALLSIFRAPNLAEAISLVRDVVLCALTFFLALPALGKNSRFPVASLGLAASATALLGILQILGGARLTWLPSTQGGALVGDVSTAALFVCGLLPLLLSLALSEGGWRRAGWTSATGAAAGFVLLARTRAAWLGALTGLILLAILIVRGRRRVAGEATPREFAVAGKLTGLICLLVLLLILWGSFGAGISLLSASPSLKTVELEGIWLRLASWSASLRMVLTHPMGVGAGNWRYVFPSVVGDLEPRSPFTAFRIPAQAGNEYLEITAELGPAGLVLLLWFLWRLLSGGWRRSLEGKRGLAGAATAGIGGLAAGGLLASPLREQPTLWAATMLAALALAPARESGGEAGSGRSTTFSWAIDPGRRVLVTSMASLLFLGLAAFSIWGNFRTLSSSAWLRRGQTTCFRKEYDAALPALLEAGRLDPQSFPARYLAGACALEAGRLDLAEKELREARRLSPFDAATLLALASTLRGRGNLIDAVAVCEKAHRIWPRDERVNLALGDLRHVAGDRKEAVAAYETAILGNPNSVRGYLGLGDVMDQRNQLLNSTSAYAKAVSLDPYLPEALFKLGVAYMKQGAYESAIQVFSNLLTLTPEDVPTLLSLSRAYTGLLRHCEALPLLEKSRGLERNPARQAGIDEILADVRAKCEKSSPRR